VRLVIEVGPRPLTRDNMRTLTFGDRTISYDAGLDTCMSTNSATNPASSFKISGSQYEMSERKVSVAKSESADSGVEGDVDAENVENQDDNEEISERKVIAPDDFAVRELLNFDEEEEDDYLEDESDVENADSANTHPEARNQSVFNKKWRQAVVKDLTLGKGGQSSGPGIVRSDSLDQVLTTAGDGGDVQLSLKEVGHIRRVLARAELEASGMSAEMRMDLEQGRVCAVCHKTRFGRLSRGRRCELCSVVVCTKCVDTASRVSGETKYDITDIPRHLLSPSTLTSSDTCSKSRHNCAGSAPNSPRMRRSADATCTRVEEEHGHVSLPLQPPTVTSRSALAGLGRSTLPRRWSMATWSGQDTRVQHVVNVCLQCKNMIKQILRTKGYNKRM